MKRKEGKIYINKTGIQNYFEKIYVEMAQLKEIVYLNL